MYTTLLVLILFVAIILILIVMVQNPKGGGLSSSFGGGGTQSIGGVQNTNTFLDKATWILAIALFSLILVSNYAIDRSNVSGGTQTELNETLEGVQTAPASEPVAPEGEGSAE